MLPALLAVFATFVATLLLLLVSLSVPIIKSIDLFNLAISYRSSGVDAVLEFGVWGYCHSTILIPLLGTASQTERSCSTPKLGYQLDSTTARALKLDDLTDIVSKTLSAALVLHPIACGLAFICFVVTFFDLFRRQRHFQSHGTERDGRSRLTTIIPYLAVLPTALLTTVIFIIDVASVATARSKLRDALNDNHNLTVQLTWDSAVWMTMVATLALWFAFFATACPCGSRLRHRKRTYY